jgi:hypothetical protein
VVGEGDWRALDAWGEDLALPSGLPDTGKLELAAQLAYWRQNGRFFDIAGCEFQAAQKGLRLINVNAISFMP